ncbi:hypothetical protein [Allochromatium tepidum]|uniref:Uncharacterized protein n=1 Tax=Allochromatium tepidum TaxID=553982 RepID=A0ABM7QHZ1_9GAMM|nr:hypothetical protein [Allochromatium tepidum]BCU05386.1 hypothetical protein Atep_00630 [Allochromatium tepidum]
MPIRAKLALGLIAILALNLLASLHGFHRLTQAASREAEILETSSDILTLALKLEVDRQVRGIDREPTDLLDRVVESALAHRETTLARVQIAARQHQLWNLILTGALMSGAALLLMWLVDRSIGRPIATATAVA